MNTSKESRKGFRPVFLAYVDDSGSNPLAEYQVMAAVVIPDGHLSPIEINLGLIVANLIPPDEVPAFEEFHASDLFGGYGVFKDIGEKTRFTAIRELLAGIQKYELPIMYGSVRRDIVGAEPAPVVQSIDTAFRQCLPKIETWMNERDSIAEMCLLIVDDSDEAKNRAVRDQLQKSYREMRPRLRPPAMTRGQLTRFHDGMLFSDSRDSVGIQLADLCAYFICRHLRGEEKGDEFYAMFSAAIQD